MDYKSFFKKVYYVDNEEFIINLIFTFIIMASFKIISFSKIELIQDLLSLFYIIAITLLDMLAIHLRIISKRKIYGVISLFLIIIGVINLINFMPSNYFINIKKVIYILGFNEYNEFQYINLLIIYYLLFKYRFKNKNIIYFKYITFFMLSIILIVYSNITIIKYINFIIINILIVLILIQKINNDIKFKIKNRGIDLLSLNLYIIVANYLISVFSKMLDNYLMYSNISFFLNTIMASNLFMIIKRVMKENYNFLFKETNETNKHLECINKNLIKNNSELEKKYEIIKKRKIIYQSFLNNSPEPIVILNRKHRIVYGNMKFLNLISKDNIREIVNRKINSFIDISLDNLNLSQTKEKNMWVKNIQICNKNLEVRIFNINNEFKEFICLFKDITFDIKLNIMKKELEEIKVKEKIKNNFLSNISHDLKIPVNIIYSATQLEKILIKNNDKEKILNYNKVIKENCFLLTKFTNNLIDITKIDSETLEKNLVNENIVEFIEDYITSISTYIKKDGIELIFDTSNEEIMIEFDKEMIQRIFLNLFSNSLKFISNNGKINIYIEDFKDFIKIYFSDNGKGMSKEFQKKIFEKYEKEERTKEINQKGFGIGLFVVYNLVKAQNGNIQVESEIDKGTTFIITMFK